MTERSRDEAREWSPDEWDAYITRNDDLIRDHEELVGGVRPKQVYPVQRRAFDAGFSAGMLRAAEICEDWEYGETCARKIRDEANAKS